MPKLVRMAGVAGALPSLVRTSAEVEDLVCLSGGGFKPRKGSIQALTGIRDRRVAENDVQCSDLAVDACQQVLAATNVDSRDVDMLIYASAGQDLIEPATARYRSPRAAMSTAIFTEAGS